MSLLERYPHLEGVLENCDVLKLEVGIAVLSFPISPLFYITVSLPSRGLVFL